ncbi:MAG TPA: septum site-determining protein MinC [Anaerolineae bacterium]|nr:septum site-determining protein MinC [Anaerolineae bacterium]
MGTRDQAITIKGTNEGLLIALGEGAWPSLLTGLEERLSTRSSFFVGGRVALRVGDRALSAAQLRQAGELLERFGVTLWAVEGAHPATQTAARDLGLEVRLQQPTAAPAAPEQVPLEEMSGIVVRGTLRSGQAIRHAGHVTLIGDVNPGAEVVAGGHVIVWGKLRGTVHAGALGDERAVVCALELAPAQIRIGGHIARSPERSRRPKAPEIAHVDDEGHIVVEGWEKKKRWRVF